MKRSKLFLMPLLAVPLLTGCKSASSEITLTIWEDDSNIKMVEVLAKEFVANYKATYPDAPKINIEFVAHTEKSAIESLASGIAESGEGPDIAAVTHDTIAGGVGNQIVSPALYADSIVARMSKDAVNAVTVHSDTLGDVIYGYPITAESMTIMYDKTKISPAELASFEAISDSGKKLAIALTGDDGGYYTWGLYNDSELFGPLGKDKSAVDIGTEHAVNNVYSFYKDHLDSFLDATPEVAANYFAQNRIVGLISSPFILDTMKNVLGDNLAIATLPTINGETLRPFSGYKAYIVSRYSKNAALAHALCNYITSADAMLYRLTEKGYLPAIDLDQVSTDQTILDIQEFIANDEFSQVFKASLDDSMVMPNIPEMGNLWRPLNNASTYFKDHRSELTTTVVKTKLDEVTNTLKGSH